MSKIKERFERLTDTVHGVTQLRTVSKFRLASYYERTPGIWQWLAFLIVVASVLLFLGLFQAVRANARSSIIIEETARLGLLVEDETPQLNTLCGGLNWVDHCHTSAGGCGGFWCYYIPIYGTCKKEVCDRRCIVGLQGFICKKINCREEEERCITGWQQVCVNSGGDGGSCPGGKGFGC